MWSYLRLKSLLLQKWTKKGNFLLERNAYSWPKIRSRRKICSGWVSKVNWSCVFWTRFLVGARKKKALFQMALNRVKCDLTLACEQALHLGDIVKSRFAARSRVLARLASLAQKGELAHRLTWHGPFIKIEIERLLSLSAISELF